MSDLFLWYPINGNWDKTHWHLAMANRLKVLGLGLFNELKASKALLL